jgi:glutaryl-CoA dehydrogenase
MAKTDLYEAPDYYQIDELLSEEHKLSASVRDWVKKELSPIIEDYAQKPSSPNSC